MLQSKLQQPLCGLVPTKLVAKVQAASYQWFRPRRRIWLFSYYFLAPLPAYPLWHTLLSCWYKPAHAFLLEPQLPTVVTCFLACLQQFAACLSSVKPVRIGPPVKILCAFSIRAHIFDCCILNSVALNIIVL